MRIAFVDLFFSWPPHGGACTDLYETLVHLERQGHDVHLFAASDERSWERGRIDLDDFAVPCTRLEFSGKDFNRHDLPKRFKQAIDLWRPDAVIVADAFFLKPYLIDALKDYPLAGRYYAYEIACPKDFRLFREGAICPNNYLRTPDVCRRCAVAGMREEISTWRLSPWAHEYMLARAFMPGYRKLLIDSLKSLKAVIVYNSLQKSQLEGIHSNVHIVPGGVDIERFDYVDKSEAARKIIVMVGRAEDPAKGMETLHRAAHTLAERRDDFEVWVTHPDATLNEDHFKSVGWKDGRGLVELYRQADICVVPSIWQEPFGMVAVEAGAVGRPVCASRVGGLQDIVVDGETGFLFEPGDYKGLAEHLGKLLDNSELRLKMGKAARKRVEAEYDWLRVIEKSYPPILEQLVK